MTELRQAHQQLAGLAKSLGFRLEADGQPTSTGAPTVGPGPERIEELIQQIETAYKNLGATRRKHARAETARRRHEIRVRQDNADALMTANNERTQKLYLEGLLDTEQHRKLQDDEKRAELEHFEARCEVDRLQLTVKLLRTAATVADSAEEARP